MGLQPARLKQENNRNLMYRVYLHEFCKVVTSEYRMVAHEVEVYLHEFCKVVTSVTYNKYVATKMYMHRFCKVVTSGNL